MENKIGYIHSTESFGTVDGEGVRFIIFMQGCRMRCQFCHNPDTWKIGAGKEYTPDELLKEAVKYRSYWGDKGGITVSGGEPLLQIDFIIELFKKAKEQGINTTLDTCGQPFTRKEPFFSKFKELLSYTDLILLDIKQINTINHRELTGHPNENIIDLANFLNKINFPVWIRHVLIPSKTDIDSDLDSLGQFIKTLSNVQRVEVLPYHTMGVAKWDKLKLDYPLKGIKSPSKERIKNAEKLLGIE